MINTLSRKKTAVVVTIVFGLAASMLAICGCVSNGASGDEPLINLNPQYRITKVTVNGLMSDEASSRIPTIGYLYQENDDDEKKLDALEWSSIFFDRRDLISYNDYHAELEHSACLLRSCEWNLEYDVSGKLASKAWSDDFGESGEYRYTYDGNGNELTARYFKNIPDETLIEERIRDYNGDVVSREDINIYITPSLSRNGSTEYEHEEMSLTNVYDDHGNVIETRGEVAGRTAGPFVHEYEYDDRGNVLVSKVIVSEMIQETTTYTYDSNDKLLSRYTVLGDAPKEEVEFGRKGEYEWTRTPDGKPLTQRYHHIGSSWVERTWQYDESGNVTVYEEYYGEDSGSVRTEYSYDELGREVEKTVINEKGIVEESRTTEYSLDGTAAMKIVKNDDDGRALIECTCTFDGNGCPTVLSAKSPADGQSIEISFEYERI